MSMNFKKNENFLMSDYKLKGSRETDQLNQFDLFIEDSTDLTIHQVRSIARKQLSKHPNIKFIGIDYAMLVKKSSAKIDKLQHIDEVSIECKRMTNELGIPVFILSQLNKLPGEPEPDKTNLQYGSQLVSDCHKLLLLYTQNNNHYLKLELNRDGMTGQRKLDFLRHITRFEDAEEE